jgi:hypothetical protein
MVLLTCKYQGTQEISQGQEKLVPSYFDFVLIQDNILVGNVCHPQVLDLEHRLILFIERAGAPRVWESN